MRLNLFGLEYIPEISEGDELDKLIIEALKKQEEILQDGDIVIVTSKIVSKAEGRVVSEKDVIPSPFAIQVAESTNRDPRYVEVIFRESSRPIKISDQVLIMESKHGFICASAGVDRSNIQRDDEFLLLPEDSDASAAQIRSSLQKHFGVYIAVVISDTFGRPWRMGQTNVAIGISGMLATQGYSGQFDTYGRELKVTSIAIADQIAGAAELVMGKTDGVPVAVLRGYPYPKGNGTAKDLIRPRDKDLFR